MTHDTTETTLRRRERLSSDDAIDRLFAEGHKGYIAPFRFWYRLREPDETPATVLFSVPKRLVKRANKRNLLRRRTKESYRLNKQRLFKQLAETKGVDIAFVYNMREIADYNTINTAVEKMLGIIAERV